MAVTDNKVLSWNITLPQILSIIGVFALCAVAIAFDALIIGYIVMTLVLCAFFLVVAFDVGITPGSTVAQPAAPGSDEQPAGGPTRRRPRRTAREI